MKYKVRDVVSTTDQFGNRTFALIGVTEFGYGAISIKEKKKYNLTDDQIKEKVGELPAESPLLRDDYNEVEGRDFCVGQARRFPSEAAKWKLLSTLRLNDTIRIVHRRTIYNDARFVRINLKKPLYPIRAKIAGIAHDFRLEALLLPN